MKTNAVNPTRPTQPTQIAVASVPTLFMRSATHLDSGVADVTVDHAYSADLDYTEADNSGSRYELRTTLGEGGMGEVRLCRDHRIGRDVAMKLVREDGAPTARGKIDLDELHDRFLREARVQGQLEHPAIVPVYDLGKDSAGRSFFTMKRVRGETLEILITRLARGDARTRADYTRHKLLAAYARVCLAVDFAHSRNVVHRDLKPANVMLGDFGEVYVLDWGVAKIHDDDLPFEPQQQPLPLPVDESGERPTLSPEDLTRTSERERSVRPSAQTEAGTVLGTPAYMAPEQQRGAPVDARMDVYALGAILFEILTFKSLHDEGSGSWSSTDKHDIPPELDAIWRRATERNPSDRYGSARDLHDAVERFLSGDRDFAARKALAAEHLNKARDLIKEISHESPTSATAAHRSRALAAVGRAIALVPDDGDALGILVDLLSMPSNEAPPEVLAELDRAGLETRLTGLRRAAMLYTLPALGFFLPAMLFMGVKSILAGVLCVGSFLIAGVVAAGAHFKNGILTKHAPWATIVSSVAMATSTVLAGVYVLLPTFVAVNTVCHAIAGRRSHRRQIVTLGVLALLIPTMLETLGLIPASHAFRGGSLVVTSHLFELKEPLMPIFLVFINVALIVFSSMFVGEYRDALSRAQLRHLSQLWLLRQLVPERARSVAVVTRDSQIEPEPPSRCPVD